MPYTNHFYTPTFVSGEKISIDKYKGWLDLDFRRKTAIKRNDSTEEDLNWKEPSLKNIKTKLKKFDKGGGVTVNCKDLDEVDDLLNGKIKKVYLGGWTEDDEVLETVSL